MSQPAADQGAQKIAVIFKPMLDEIKKEIKEHNTAVSQEGLLAMARIEARIDVLEKLVSDKRKPATTRGEKKVAGTDGTTPTTAATADTAVTQPPGAQKNFPVNKLVYFREHFKTNPDYRAKYVTKDIQDLMDKDATITGKTNEQQKLVAQATFCWNYFKGNKQDVADAIEKEYIAAKQAHEAANKPPQQTAEAHTPPSDTA